MRDLRRSRCLSIIAAGERLAELAASVEAELAPDPWLARAFARQAAQERRHAWLFTQAAERLGVAADDAEARDVLGATALARRIRTAAGERDLPMLVAAAQGGLERLGTAVLDTIARWPVAQPFAPFLRVVALQEHAHRRIGRRLVRSDRLLAAVHADGQATLAAILALLEPPAALAFEVERAFERSLADDLRDHPGA